MEEKNKMPRTGWMGEKACNHMVPKKHGREEAHYGKHGGARSKLIGASCKSFSVWKGILLGCLPFQDVSSKMHPRRRGGGEGDRRLEADTKMVGVFEKIKV